jgi:multidrug resistance efflux pump
MEFNMDAQKSSRLSVTMLTYLGFAILGNLIMTMSSHEASTDHFQAS